MKKFFLNQNTYIPFKIGGIIHIGCILIVVLALYLIFKNRKNIEKIKNKKTIKVIMCIIMYLNMFIYYFSYAYYGVYNWKLDLPFHFCFISGILFMIYLILGNEKIYKLVYFFSLMGPLPAILFPDITTSFDSYIFYQYFISHHLFIIFNLFVFYLDNVYIEKRDIINAMLYANIIFGIMFIFNNIFGTNYIMSQSLPEHVLNLMPILRTINNPFIILELTAIIIALIAYIPASFKNNNDRFNFLIQK